MQRKQIQLAAVAAALACAFATAAHAQVVHGVTRAAQPVPFAQGGVGKDERAVMGRLARNYNVRMQFSERRDNELVQDVDVVVRDARGRRVFARRDAGPLLDVRLAPGTYDVSATVHGQTRAQRVTLHSRDHRNLAFHWAGAPKFEPYDGRPVAGRHAPG